MLCTVSRRTAPLLLMCLALGVPSLAQESVVLPGGVTDEHGEVGYVAGVSGSIEALDLAKGLLLWTNAERAQPLLIGTTRLVAQTSDTARMNQLRIVVLDTAHQGRRLLQSDPVVFPDWVVVRGGEGLTFALKPRLEGDRLVLDWTASSRYRGGAPPPREIAREARKDACGAVVVDLKTGRVSPRKEQPETVPSDDASKATLGVASAPYLLGTVWKTTPLVVDDDVVALDLHEVAGGQELYVKRWPLRAGTPGEPTLLIRGKRLLPQLTLDRRNLLVREAESPADGPWAWRVFSLKTGQLVSNHLTFEAGAESATVLGPRIYYAVAAPPSGERGPATGTTLLKAAALDSGICLWTHPIQGRISTPRALRP